MNIDTDAKYSQTIRLLIIGASFVIIIAGMQAAKSILVPFLLSVFIAIISSPLLFWLQRKKIPMIISLILVILIVLGISLLIGLLVGSSLNDFSHSLPDYQARLQDKTSSLFNFLGKYGITISDKIIFSYINPGSAMGLASKMLTSLGNVLGNAFFILLTVIFILLEAASFPSKIDAAFGAKINSMEGINRFLSNINQYMVIKTWMSLATGMLVAIWLAILGIDYAVLWGLLAFLFNYVPNIGSIIAAIPAVLLAFIQLGVSRAILAAIGYLVFNIVIGSILEPRFMGRGLGLSTLVVFLSLIFWGWVLGPVGMILSIPLTMTVKIALESNEETRWGGILLG